MYDHTKQYRCTIIRGKSQKEIDDLLPAYAKVIDEVCPCKHEDFKTLFNNAFVKFLSSEIADKEKTLDNHRTEISGKLFGMYFFADDGYVYESERTQKFLADNDQPAFFKDFCYKFQFPNGMQKIKPTVMERVEDGINLRPYSFLLMLLLAAKNTDVIITKRKIGYYVLNSLDVLQGNASPDEVLKQMAADQKAGIKREIHIKDEFGHEKKHSFKYQHITEQLNYLELANLIRYIDNPLDRGDARVVLNPNESKLVELFASEWNKPPMFNVASYDLSTAEKRSIFQYQWDDYNGKLSEHSSLFSTSASSLIFTGSENENSKVEEQTGPTTTEIGDEGEALIFNFEKNRVAAFNPRLVSKVLSLGKTHGLGYDIQSVVAESGETAEFVKYIEVKSTKRLTCPDINDNLWIDTVNITRNEMIAAKQHGDYYSIYRVYFTRDGVSVFVLSNVSKKIDDGTIQVTPVTYRLDFSSLSVDKTISIEGA